MQQVDTFVVVPLLDRAAAERAARMIGGSGAFQFVCAAVVALVAPGIGYVIGGALVVGGLAQVLVAALMWRRAAAGTPSLLGRRTVEGVELATPAVFKRRGVGVELSTAHPVTVWWNPVKAGLARNTMWRIVGSANAAFVTAGLATPAHAEQVEQALAVLGFEIVAPSST